MKETLKAYLAGILDADGYFTIKRSTYSMRVRKDASNPVFSEKIGMKQVVPIVIDILHDNFGGSRHIEKPSAMGGRPLYSWQVTDKKAARVAKLLLPYLQIKRRQAQILLNLRHNKNTTKRIHDGTYHEINNRWGGITRRKRLVVSPDTVDLRSDLLIEIRSLNDTRNTQPVLI